jgi:hypothetical protein
MKPGRLISYCLILAGLWQGLLAEVHTAPQILEYVERNDKVRSLEDIHFFVRMPQSLQKDETVRGVLVYLIYLRDPAELKK